MRIIMIPGLGEDEFIFSKLAALVPCNKIVLNTWTLFGNERRGSINVLNYAREVAARYAITKNDLVIGHSLGGLTAWYLKYLLGCPIIQIASYTHKNRIIVPVSSYRLIEGSIRTHVFFNNVVRLLVSHVYFSGKPSSPVVDYLFERLRHGNEVNVINQLKVALNPLTLPGVEPDLRIHSLNDSIVRPPKEPYYMVPGDHFALYTHPEPIAAVINAFLANP